MKKILVALGLAILVVPIAVVALLGLSGGAAAAACVPSSAISSIPVVSKLPDAVGGYKGAQLRNAAIIIKTADTHQVGAPGAMIGLIVAIQESGLKSLANAGQFQYPAAGSSVMTLQQWQQLQPAVARSAQLPNDGVAPGDWDSIGAFQQRLGLGYGGTGTLDQQAARLLDIAYTSGVFFDRLAAVSGWQDLAPGVAAQAVQRSAYPDRYATHWADAQALMKALGGVEVTAAPGRCSTAVSTASTSASGWTKPITDYTELSSPFGPRSAPTAGASTFHEGQDFAAPKGTPIYAAADGVVIKAGAAGPGTNNLNWVVIDHGNGLTTCYLHSDADGILVDVGQQVLAGQQIALVGNSGYTTGPHLHFEARVNGVAIEPLGFLASMGVTY